MNTKHTPGPWIVKGGDDTGAPLPIWSDSADECVAVTQGQPHNFADARLISEAPAMLAALRILSRELHRFADNGLVDPVYSRAFRQSAEFADKTIARIDSAE